MNQKEGNKLLLNDVEIHGAVVRILKDRIERAIEKQFGKEFRNDDGQFQVQKTHYSEPLTNDIINYLIEQLAEKTIQLNETDLQPSPK